MGCGSSRAAVLPKEALSKNRQTDANTNMQPQIPIIKEIRKDEAKSVRSEDSGFSDTASSKAHASLHRGSSSAKTHRSRQMEDKPHSAGSMSTRSAPDRPVSRSGCAFEVVYESKQGGSSPRRRLPARLQAIEHRMAIRHVPTLDELQTKLDRAEQRRKKQHEIVKSKMSMETKKAHTASSTLERERTQILGDVNGKVDKASSNREKHLKAMRDKLRSKEERAARVRQNRERLRTQAMSEVNP